MKPEEKAEIILWDWLKPTKENNVKTIYFNRKNEINAPVFTTSGVNKKPDFLILINRGYGNEIIGTEIKDSSSAKNIHDSGKILMYYENYISGKTKYFIDGQEIKINHFAVMSNESPKGKLFLDDNELITNEKSSDGWRATNSKLNLMPKQEYQRTSDFLRGLWSKWRTTKKELQLEKTKLPSIGIIISNPNQDNSPYFFCQTYVDYSNKKSWGQRFWRL